MTGNKTGYVLVIALAAAMAAPAQVGVGGAYTLEQSVIAGGGGTGTGGSYSLEGTTAQSITGAATELGYSLRSGFWSQAPLAPSAAGATISGRVVLENGAGLRNAIVYLEGGRLTAPLIAQTGSFGYFSFENVEVGLSYTLTVISKKYGFANGTRAFTLMDSIEDMVFEATWEDQ